MTSSLAPLLGAGSAGVVAAGAAALRSFQPIVRDAPERSAAPSTDHGSVIRSSTPRVTDPRRRFLFAAGLAVATLIIGVVLTIALAVGLWARPRLAEVLEVRRQRRQVELDFPDALDMFVLLVHAGLTSRQAVGELGQRGPPSCRRSFERVQDRADRGDSFADSLPVLTDDLGPQAVALVDLVSAADRYGLPLAGVLEQLAAESRASRRRLNEAAARALPVKLSFPLVACTLPSFVLLAIVPAVMAALSSLSGTTW